MLKDHLHSFEQAGERIMAHPGFGPAWLCETGLWRDATAPDAVVLKLLKPHWSHDRRETPLSSSGLFFSVWIDAAALAKKRLRYNLHALKLRELKGYRLESRKFATAFRTVFQPHLSDWPNVRTDFGPQTLFEGEVEYASVGLKPVIVALAQRFQPFGKVIDNLLAQAARHA